MKEESENKVEGVENAESLEETESKKKFLEVLAEQKEVLGISYELRNLKDKDLFPLLKILKKVGIKDFKNAFTQNESDQKSPKGQKVSEEQSIKSAETIIKNAGISVAFDLADILICNMGNVEGEVYDLWSDISGIPVDEMKELEFGTLPLMIAETFLQVRNYSFFKVLSKFL